MKRELHSNLKLHETLHNYVKKTKEHKKKHPHPHENMLPAEYVHPVRQETK